MAAETSGEPGGDGDGDGELPGAPQGLTWSPSAIKQFNFTWAPAERAELYQLLERANPEADYQVVGTDTIATAASLTVPLHLRKSASYRVRACNDAGCTDSEPVNVEGSLAEAVGYVKASNASGGGPPNAEADNGAFGDYFGTSVALSRDGRTLAVGADWESSCATGVGGDQSDDGCEASGAVYVFTRDEPGTWSQQAYLKPPEPAILYTFGARLALSGDGNTLVVSAPEERSSAKGIDGEPLGQGGVPQAGAAYVFIRDPAGTWSQQVYVKPSNTNEIQHFGRSVAMSEDGRTFAVGAPGEGSNAKGINGDQADVSLINAGAVYVFVRDELGAWSQQAYVKASNTISSMGFGEAVALSEDGSTLAVGADGEWSCAAGIDGDQFDECGHGVGAAYVFTRDLLGAWSQQAYVKASNPEPGDHFGVAVALSGDGDTLAVGAQLEDSSATGIGGDQTSNSAVDAGAVYVFTRDVTQTWSQQAYIKAPNAGADDRFGGALTLSGDGRILAVGALLERSNATGIDGDETDESLTAAGAVYVFTRGSTDVWTKEAYVKASNSGHDDVFGWSLALSEDGQTLAIGARKEAGGSTGIGGDQSDDSALGAGAAYLY